MNVFNPRFRDAAVPVKRVEGTSWKQFAKRIFRLLAEQPSKEQWERFFAEISSAPQTDSKFGLHLAETAVEHIEAFIKTFNKDLDEASEECDGRILTMYCDQWLAFIKSMELLTKILRGLESPLIASSLVNACVSFWTISLLRRKGSVTVRAMLRVLSRKIFGEKVDPKHVGQVYKIIASFKTMHCAARHKAFERFQSSFEQFIIRESLREHVMASLSQKSCRKTVVEIDRWKRAILKTAKKLHLTERVEWVFEDEFTYRMSNSILEKAAKEVAGRLKELWKSGKHENIISLSDIAEKERLEHLWSSHPTSGRGLPSVLRWMERTYKLLESICGERSTPLLELWVYACCQPLQSEIKAFPTDPDSRIEDSRAYCDFYIESWSSFCRNLIFHDMLWKRLHEAFNKDWFFFNPFWDWVDAVIVAERGNLYDHLTVLLREYFSNPEAELDMKVLAVVNSLRIMDIMEHFVFRDHYIKHVVIPHADDVAEELPGKLTQQNCVSEIKRVMDRAEHARKKMHYPEWVHKELKERVMKLYYDFISLRVQSALMDDDVNAINEMCDLIDRDRTEEDLDLLTKLFFSCKLKGQMAIAFHLKGENLSPSSLFSAIVKSSAQFDKLVDSIKSAAVKLALISGFGSAIERETKMLGYEAHQILLEHFIPLSIEQNKNGVDGMGDTHMEEVVRAFKFVKNSEGLSQLYACRFVSRVLNKPYYSGELEEKMFRILRKFMEKNKTRRLEQQLSDVLTSEKRMKVLPSAFGFKSSIPEPITEKSMSDEQKALEAVEKLKQWKRKKESKEEFQEEKDGEPNGTLKFQGIEVNIRVLRRKIWPILPPDVTFTPPPILQDIMQSFEKIYRMEYSDPKLIWAHQFSRVEMRWRFTSDERTYDVDCNSYVAAVMLTFEQTDETTLEKLQEQTNMSKSYLESVVDRLLGENVLLKKRGSCAGDLLYLNTNFKSCESEFSLDVVHDEKRELLEKTKPETKREQRRKLMNCTQAALVRVAKRASKISKKELVQHAIWDLGSLVPGPNAIKSALGELIDKKYLDYDEVTGICTYVP